MSAADSRTPYVSKVQVEDAAGDVMAIDASGYPTVNVNGTVSTSAAVPVAANVIAGTVSHTSTTAAATIVTIAAGKTWRGTIGISCDVGIAAASATAGQALGVITTAGTNATPAAGTYLACEARAGANAATGTVGAQGANSVACSDFVVIAPAGNAVTIQGASTIAGTAGRVDFFAAGIYLA
jgi:hypothetical protein